MTGSSASPRVASSFAAAATRDVTGPRRRMGRPSWRWEASTEPTREPFRSRRSSRRRPGMRGEEKRDFVQKDVGGLDVAVNDPR